MLKVGLKAPDFTLTDENGNIRRLSDYKGHSLLLYFYPKDFTPGCATEACQFRDNFGKLSEKIIILGVSSDGIESHRKFKQKYNLPFSLLADQDKKAREAYEANEIIFAKRVSFLIDSRGVIQRIYDKVNPETHVTQILADLASLPS